MELHVFKPVFHFNRIVGERGEVQSYRHETMKYATFRYDTVEVQNRLYYKTNLELKLKSTRSYESHAQN